MPKSLVLYFDHKKRSENMFSFSGLYQLKVQQQMQMRNQNGRKQERLWKLCRVLLEGKPAKRKDRKLIQVVISQQAFLPHHHQDHPLPQVHPLLHHLIMEGQECTGTTRCPRHKRPTKDTDTRKQFLFCSVCVD